MKHLLLKYANYNLWANKQLMDVLVNLDDEQLTKDTGSSFPSIFKTLLHLCDAECMWWQRTRLSENITRPSAAFSGSILELGNLLMNQSKQWKEWIDTITEAGLQHEFIYKNSKKDSFKQPVYEVLLHVFNHQSFHRGQIITMLRQAGATNLPVTDMIAFLRKK